MPWVLSEPVKITVPGPPKAWERAGHRIVTARSGRQFVSSYTPAQTRHEQSFIRALACTAMGDRPLFSGPIDLQVVAYMGVPASWSNKKRAAALSDQIRPTSKPDFDNLAKSLCDAVKGIVWVDDFQVTDPHGPWKRYSDHPRLVIEFALSPGPPDTTGCRKVRASVACRPARCACSKPAGFLRSLHWRLCGMMISRTTTLVPCRTRPRLSRGASRPHAQRGSSSGPRL